MIKADNALEAKVQALNLANARILAMLPKVLESLKALVGQKVLNQGNVISQKVKAILPTVDNSQTPQVQVWYHASNYSLSLHVKVSCNYPNRSGEFFSCVYQEAYAHLGDIDGHTLKAIARADQQFRTDYTAQEVKTARQHLSVAKRAVRDAESKLQSFGEYDSN